VIEMAWFYRCKPEPDVEPEKDCPLRFWKDTSGRYVDRQSVKALLADGKTGPLEGFTARSGRTYKGFLELDKSEGETDPSKWRVKVRSLGYEPGQAVSDTPEYDVDPEPLGRCPLDDEFQIVETPTHFVCESKLKSEEPVLDGEAPKFCGFQFPRTVCKREITRDEALVYLRERKTELLTDFTSRFGRPFSAILVLKENGKHGFEFPPRGKAAAAEAAGEGSAAASESPAPKPERKRAPRRAAAKAELAGETKRPRRKAAARKSGTAKPKRSRSPRAARRDEPSGTES
jgi:DNA topoisomerase-3